MSKQVFHSQLSRNAFMNSGVSRRQFLKNSALAGLAFSLNPGLIVKPSEPGVFSFGIVADLHYADKEVRNNRYYRHSATKLAKCVETFNRIELPFLIALGDFVDKAPNTATELQYLITIRRIFSEYRGHCYAVLGNHDLARFTKDEFLQNFSPAIADSYYSFDAEGYHFVVLDGNFRRDGRPYERGNFTWKDTFVPLAQRRWLERDLRQAAKRPVFVFIHQNLHDESSRYGVKNADHVRAILEKAGNVLAVIQGHDHRGGYRKVNGIHYFTLKALVDGPTTKNNAFGIVSVDKARRVRIRGFGKQHDMILA